MKFFVFAYLALLALYPAIHALDFFDTLFILRALRSLLALTTIIVLPSIVLTIFVQMFTKRHFSFWALLNLSAMFALVGLPLLLMAETAISGQLSITWPVLNAVFALVALLLVRQWRSDYRVYAQLPAWPAINQHAVLLVGLVIYCAVILGVVTAYYPLPDFDPYYWLRAYQQFATHSNITELPSRPLFFFLIYIFNQVALLDTYAFLKYVLPSLFILPLLPAWQLARTYSSKYIQLAILLLPLASPSTILYAQIAMPQAIFITITCYFFFWLALAAKFKEPLFFYAAGILAVTSFFYYEIAVVLALVWLLIFMITDWRQILNVLQKQKLAVLLLTLIIASNFSLLQKPYNFITFWLQYIVNNAEAGLYWQFPAAYTNVDGNAMGWPGLDGVGKYYLFYAGPAVLFFIAAFFSSTRWRNAKNFLTNRSYAVVMLSFLLFFIVAEILPRLTSLAILPERAWIFAGILSSLFFFTLIDKLKPKHANTVAIISITLVFISIGGSLYINSFKKYLIPNYQLESAAWIRENIPSDAIILTSSHNNLLITYAQARITGVTADIFCDPLVADPAQLLLKATTPKIQAYLAQESAVRQQLTSELQTYISSTTTFNEDDIVALIRQHQEKLQLARSPLNIDTVEQTYIYFSREHPNNPYAGRPYRQKNSCQEPIFSKYPNQYTEVYNDQNQVVIWQIK